MEENLFPKEKDSAKIYEFKIERPVTEEEQRAVDVLKMIRKAGFEAYFAGGAVRDELMGIPAHDIDIATSALPNQVKKIFKGNCYDRGEKFGVLAVTAGKYEFEIATFRSDI